MSGLYEMREWTKRVLAERNDGKHFWLVAHYFCGTRVEAVTLESCCSPSRVVAGDEILERVSPQVYRASSGHKFVIFDWKSADEFVIQPLS